MSPRSHSSVQDGSVRPLRKLFRWCWMPPRDRDRLDFVHLELCTNALILNGIGAPLLKRQVCAAARWSRSLLAGARRSRTCPALARASKTRVTFLSCVRVDRRFGHIGLPDHGARAGSALTAESHSGEPPKPFARPSPLAVASSHPSSLPPPLHIPSSSHCVAACAGAEAYSIFCDARGQGEPRHPQGGGH